MHWMVLENKKQYDSAVNRIEELMDINPQPKSDMAKEMRLLLFLIEKYENEHYSIDLPDPIEAIRIRMNDLGLEMKDLVPAIGDKGTVSKVLNRRIPLSLRMIRNLTGLLGLPADVLIQEVKLKVA